MTSPADRCDERVAADPGFLAQVYLHDGTSFAEERSIRRTGQLAGGLQELVFPLPAGAAGLRLDPADRPGFIDLQAIRLLRDGAVTWEWVVARQGWRAFDACSRHQVLLPLDPGPLLSCGDDPWIELPLPASLLGGPAGLELQVDLAWTGDAVPEPGRMALQALVRQLEQHRLLQAEAAQTRRMYLHSRMEARRLARERAALQRRLDAIDGAAARVQPLADTVDVVVPVYLDLGETQRCVESVLAAANRCAWRLVIVNDASPEPALAGWLRELAGSDARVVLLENLENLGYGGAVNRGIGASEANDVILLNSDTEVANDWIDRLRAAAYSDARVFSVTPFSNNATICSYPRMCEDNALPAGWNVADLDRAFAEANRNAVLDIPTAVGFCMYVRRDGLRDVGLFDMELFGKGYGEENDLCLRAADAGWRNLHALDVFVRHTGGVSFGASKKPREAEAMVLLRQLYPGYEPDVHDYIQRDPPAQARARAGAALAAMREEPSA
ncbi:glycosyltransferase family 2 protein [Caenimonas sedimenti]|uniref:Glycosyltransferase family 2 protein n=1 Tax=Caenimonas sedimenti TaxID=2596921 RepID=A0A562ZVP2_9BURK|nr:glycosyltransferase family 2 protein [Caenimonas sedimenti]TWO72388.1 glycosyltransferase family 2 protein [Caenimonas sedimenti]